MSEAAPVIFLDANSGDDFGRTWRFRGHVATLQAFDREEVLPVLAEVETYAAAGCCAVGFITYEAAAGLNPDLPSARSPDGLPLLWFAVYRERYAAASAAVAEGTSPVPPRLEPDISRQHYLESVARIKEYIASGDSYQVNYTFTMSGAFSGDPLPLYRSISRGQQASFSAYIDTGRFTVVSASPELFFSLRDGVIMTRPMKGTAPRGRWLEEDRLRAAALRASAKERAENLMIVDLLRNDLGRIAATGSVTVTSLFDVETYPTLHQLTSTITAAIREETGPAQALAALFPCGSVTGAPKRRSMEIIRELESGPRGLYCGAVGYVAPGGEALFSVAIRTLLFDRDRQTVSLGVGSGITADSDADREYRECLLKSAFLYRSGGEFALLESLRLENGGYLLLDRHLERLGSSAAYFGFSFDPVRVGETLARHAAAAGGVEKVRLLLAGDGSCTLSAEPLADSDAPLSIAISGIRVDSGDIFRYHKTTRRELLDSARTELADVDEVIFLNERGELTEGSYHNLLLTIDGTVLTPRRGSGLLAGVMRQELLASGAIAEATLYPEDLHRAEEIRLINSVRGLRRALLHAPAAG
jgi:para-aminobenzoate synthetase/4-amino-4-deoxychorismate lyase